MKERFKLHIVKRFVLYLIVVIVFLLFCSIDIGSGLFYYVRLLCSIVVGSFIGNRFAFYSDGFKNIEYIEISVLERVKFDKDILRFNNGYFDKNDFVFLNGCINCDEIKVAYVKCHDKYLVMEV